MSARRDNGALRRARNREERARREKALAAIAVLQTKRAALRPRDTRRLRAA